MSVLFAFLCPFSQLLVTMLAFPFKKQATISSRMYRELAPPLAGGWTCSSSLAIKTLHSLVTVICLSLGTWSNQNQWGGIKFCSNSWKRGIVSFLMNLNSEGIILGFRTVMIKGFRMKLQTEWRAKRLERTGDNIPFCPGPVQHWIFTCINWEIPIFVCWSELKFLSLATKRFLPDRYTDLGQTLLGLQGDGKQILGGTVLDVQNLLLSCLTEKAKLGRIFRKLTLAPFKQILFYFK